MKFNPKEKSLFYKSIFIVGLVAIIWEIFIYRQTIIDLKILFSIIFIVGVLTTYFGLKDFQQLFNYRNKLSLYFWTFFQSSVSWGFLACSIFMLANYYLASNNSLRKTYEIVERSSLPGRKYHRDERKPTFKIMYNGNLKELVFPHRYYDNMDVYKKVELEIKEGFFGFDILVRQELK